MRIRFLRPELEALHTRMRALFATMGTEVDVDAFAYELFYATYGDGFRGEGLYLDVLLPYLAEHAPAPASILDVGGGTGRLAIPLAQAGYNVTILDPAASGLRIACEKAQTEGVSERLTYMCGGAGDAGALGEDAFDAVVGIQSVLVEKDLGAALAGLLRVTRKVLCFDVASRYGFLAGRMPGGFWFTEGYTPASMLRVLTERRTPGERTLRQEQYPLYSSGEVARIAGDVGLRIDAIRPVSFQGVFEWQGESDPASVSELEARMREDPVLKELASDFLVLGRKGEGVSGEAEGA